MAAHLFRARRRGPGIMAGVGVRGPTPVPAIDLPIAQDYAILAARQDHLTHPLTGREVPAKARPVPGGMKGVEEQKKP